MNKDYYSICIGQENNTAKMWTRIMWLPTIRIVLCVLYILYRKEMNKRNNNRNEREILTSEGQEN